MKRDLSRSNYSSDRILWAKGVVANGDLDDLQEHLPPINGVNVPTSNRVRTPCAQSTRKSVKSDSTTLSYKNCRQGITVKKICYALRFIELHRGAATELISAGSTFYEMQRNHLTEMRPFGGTQAFWTRF